MEIEDHCILSLRDQVRNRIEKRIEDHLNGYRQNIGLIARRGLGKTHLFSRLFESVSGRPSLLPVFVQAEFSSYETFVECWSGAFLTSLFISQAVTPPTGLLSLMMAAEPIVPQSVEKIRLVKKLIRQGKGAQSVKELFSLPTLLGTETGKAVLLIIDEFQGLEKLPVPDPFSLLGKEIMVSKSTLFWVSSSVPDRATEIFHHKLSLLFGNFEILELTPLNFQEVFSFVSKRIGDRIVTPAQMKFLVRLTDGNPTYLDFLTDTLKRLSAEHFNRELPKELLIETVLCELGSSKGRLYHQMNLLLDRCGLSNRDTGDNLAVILAIAQGRHKVSAIAAAIQKKINETTHLLGRLVEQGAIVKQGGFYRLDDPLFRFWLVHYFQPSVNRFTPSLLPVSETFRAALDQEYRNAEQDDLSGIMARMEMLFKSFHNDVLKMNGRKFKLHHFHDVFEKPACGRFMVLAAKSGATRWICAVAPERVTEEDIMFFLDDLKKSRKKYQKKILLILGGIEQNAKLLAQNANLQLWDLAWLNLLLDLYNLPKIITLDERGKTVHDRTFVGAVAEVLHPA